MTESHGSGERERKGIVSKWWVNLILEGRCFELRYSSGLVMAQLLRACHKVLMTWVPSFRIHIKTHKYVTPVLGKQNEKRLLRAFAPRTAKSASPQYCEINCVYQPLTHICRHECTRTHAHTHAHIRILSHTHTCSHMHTYAHTGAHTYSGKQT